MAASRGEDIERFKKRIPEQSPFGIIVLDPDLRILWVNATMSGLYDTAREQWVGRRLDEMLPGLVADRAESMLRRVLETGEQVVDAERHGALLPGSQSDQAWDCSGFRIEEDDGAVIGVALIMSDVTGRSRDQGRLALLNQASERIGSTLDIVRTAQETLDVLVPRVADAAAVNLLSYVLDGGPQPRFSEQGTDPLLMEIAATRWLPDQPVPEALRKGSVAYLDPASLYYRWLSEGRAIFVPRFSDASAEFREMLLSEFFERRLNAVQQAGGHTIMILPIAARGVILGTVAVYRMHSAAFTEEDLSLAREVLARSAICLDNARVYNRERGTALELQRSMLPKDIGPVHGIELAYHYEPANFAAEIGGDWFDVVHQPDGRVAMIVGDVTGHDIHAACLMGQIRTVTRTLASLDLSPVEVLDRLDAMVGDMGPEVNATCVYATFEPATRRCVIARAGHPPPALLRPAGGVDFLDLPAGMPLGVGGAEFESVELTLQPGCVLVFYTDGLIESREAPIDVGMDNLAQALLTVDSEPFGSRYATALINRLVSDPADDIAVLIARVGKDRP